jgi:hypothetical protein
LPIDSTLVVTDNTGNNVSTAAHGFAPKAPNDATKFLNGVGAYANPKDSDLAVSDNTNNNVSTSEHGFAPKAPNDATKYLDGTGNYSVPSALTAQASATIVAASANNTESTSSTTYVKVKQFQVYNPGTYTVTYTIGLASGGSGSGAPVNNIEFYKNGVDTGFGDSATYLGAAQTYTGQTFTLAAGDTIEVWMKNTQPGTLAKASQITACAINAIVVPSVTVDIN